MDTILHSFLCSNGLSLQASDLALTGTLHLADLILGVHLSIPFDAACIYEILPQLIELWGLNIETQVEPKKTSLD